MPQSSESESSNLTQLLPESNNNTKSPQTAKRKGKKKKGPDQTQTSNVNVDSHSLTEENGPLSFGEQNGQPTQSSNPAEEPNSGNQNTFPSFCHRYWKKKLIVLVVTIIFMAVSVMTGFIVWILIEIAKIKEPQSVMLYRPTVEYLQNNERPETIKWRLVEEHSQSPFTQLNATHLHVKEDGFFHISCSLLMETNDQETNVITLLIFYSNEKKFIYTKKTLPTGFSRFSLQQSIVLNLKQGANFSVQVTPSKYLLKDPGGSYLSIAQQ